MEKPFCHQNLGRKDIPKFSDDFSSPWISSWISTGSGVPNSVCGNSRRHPRLSPGPPANPTQHPKILVIPSPGRARSPRTSRSSGHPRNPRQCRHSRIPGGHRGSRCAWNSRTEGEGCVCHPQGDHNGRIIHTQMGQTTTIPGLPEPGGCQGSRNKS